MNTEKHINKYDNAKIYRMISRSGLVYVGSTIRPLSSRKAAHASAHKYGGKCTSAKLFDDGGVEIFLIENFPCENIEELHKRERFYIEGTDCVNKVVPTRTWKEWHQDNLEYIRKQNRDYNRAHSDRLNEYNKQLYNANKDIINTNRKKKCVCPCGSVIRKADITKHIKNLKHLVFEEDRKFVEFLETATLDDVAKSHWFN